MSANLSALAYLVAAICFILALKGLSSPISARAGNLFGITGMIIAVVTTLLQEDMSGFGLIAVAVLIGGAVGTVIALRIKMTAMPQLVAAFHSLVGLAAVFVAAAALYAPDAYGIGTIGAIRTASLIELSLGLVIGAITFTGSIIAFAKLQALMSGAPIVYPGQHMLNLLIGIAIVALMVAFCMSESTTVFWIMTALALLIGVLIIIPIGGADGAAAATRSDKPAKPGSAEDAAFIMGNAGSVIIVPGYGMAVAQAQHAVREMADTLKEAGIKVSYAIHPVAGRMPGHMNVLLAEANVPYDEVFELDEINNEFPAADVAFVIGANDVTNPSAKKDPASPIYGMPILDVEKAKTVLFVKRSLSPGYAGIDNEVFYADHTMMLFGDAKKMTEQIIKAL